MTKEHTIAVPPLLNECISVKIHKPSYDGWCYHDGWSHISNSVWINRVLYSVAICFCRFSSHYFICFQRKNCRTVLCYNKSLIIHLTFSTIVECMLSNQGILENKNYTVENGLLCVFVGVCLTWSRKILFRMVVYKEPVVHRK